jgi:hypothetical protein
MRGPTDAVVAPRASDGRPISLPWGDGPQEGCAVHHRFRPRRPRGRQGTLVLAIIALALLASALPALPAGARSKGPAGMGEFLWGLAGQESGWNYTARNGWSGAYGRYQVMPANWPHWAHDYLGDRWADQTPRNQELVVRGKMADLHRWLGSWRRVAYWWLTGDDERDSSRWSSTARGYVRNVLALRKRAPKGGDPIPVGPAGNGPSADRGDWRLVVESANLFRRPEGKRRVRQLKDGQVLFVQRVRSGDRDVLWMRVSTAAGHIGWVSIRRTVPTRKPGEAHRWPRGGPGSDPGPDEERRRDRARPRPR